MSRTDQKLRRAALAVLVAGALLRVALALVNQEANDNHLAVIRVLADQRRIPRREELSEAFQPKLYHATVAAIWIMLPTNSLPVRVRIAQLVSCAAGLLTLLVALRFLVTESGYSARARFLSFAMLALNPPLIGINGQATNDSFVILFASATVYFGSRFFHAARVVDFSCMTASAALAVLSKGNGLVVSAAVVGAFALAWVRGASPFAIRRLAFRHGVAFVVILCVLVLPLGPYWEHYQRYGSPFVINVPPAPFPHLFEPTVVYRPGVTSIVDSLLTFRLLDLVASPQVPDTGLEYPLHRTSLWSQLYGRAHFVHFDAWPRSWRSPTPFVLNLGRLILVLALLPTALLAAGVCRRLVRMLGSPPGRGEAPRPSASLITLTAFGYIAFIILFALQYRDFSVMKAIFVFPGLLAFLMLLAGECDHLYGSRGWRRGVRLCADGMFIALFLLYVTDVLALIGHLAAFV